MNQVKSLKYSINNLAELNLSYMPFIEGGGLYIPTLETFELGDEIEAELILPNVKETIRIQGKVIWITPQNALHHVSPGIGINFNASERIEIKKLLESYLDKNLELGGYTYGMTESIKP